MKKYIVELTSEERSQLREIINAERLRRRLVEHGLDAALEHGNRGSYRARALDGVAEAHLIALAARPNAAEAGSRSPRSRLVGRAGGRGVRLYLAQCRTTSSAFGGTWLGCGVGTWQSRELSSPGVGRRSRGALDRLGVWWRSERT